MDSPTILILMWNTMLTILFFVALGRKEDRTVHTIEELSSWRLAQLFEEMLAMSPESVKPLIDAINQWQIQGNKEKL